MFKSRFIRNAGSLVAGRIDEDDHGSRAYDAGGTFVGATIVSRIRLSTIAGKSSRSAAMH